MSTIYSHIMSDTQVGEKIRAAAKDALMVSSRVHIKAQRNERVGIFCECLKKSLFSTPSENRDIRSVLTNTAIWYDIGVIDESIENWRFGAIGRAKVKLWLNIAGITNPEELEVQESFNQLARSIAIMNSMTLIANDINAQSEKLIAEMCDVFDLSKE